MRPITQEDIKVLGRIVSISTENVVADASQVWDSEWPLDENTTGWDLTNINKYFRDYIAKILRGEVPFSYLHVTGNADVDGNLTAGKLITSFIESKIGKIVLGGDVDIDGNLNVSRKITANDIEISGDTHLNRLIVDGISTFNSAVTVTSGGIFVHGDSKFFDNIVFDKNVQINGNLTVNGHTTLNTVEAESIDVKNLNVQNSLTIGGKTLNQYIQEQFGDDITNINANLENILSRLAVLEAWKSEMEIWRAKIEECYERMCGQEPQPSTVEVSGVSVQNIRVKVGETANAVVTVLPSNATNKSVTYSIADTTKATVSSTGVVTGVAVGNTTITVTSNNGKTSTANVEVYEDVTPTTTHTITWVGSNFTHSNNATTVEDGGSFSSTITANTGYVLGNDSLKVWEVVGGQSMTLETDTKPKTATVSLDNITDDVVITVYTRQDTSSEPTDHTVTVVYKLNGETIASTPHTVSSNGTGTYNSTPASPDQVFDGVVVSPNDSAVSINGTQVVITNPQHDYTITYSYTEQQETSYTVTLNMGYNVSAQDETHVTTVQEGGSYTNTFTPYTGYDITVTDNGTEVPNNADGTCSINLSNINANHVIEVTAERNSYTVYLTAKPGITYPDISSTIGTVSVNGTVQPMILDGNTGNSRFKISVPVTTNTLTYTPASGSPFVYDYSYTGATESDDVHQQFVKNNDGSVTITLSQSDMRDYTFNIVVKENILLNGQEDLEVTITPDNMTTGNITVTNALSGVVLRPGTSQIVTQDLNGNTISGNGVDDFTIVDNNGMETWAYNARGQQISNPFKVSVNQRYNVYKNAQTSNADKIARIKAGYKTIIPIGDNSVQKNLTITVSGFNNWFD